MRAVETTQIECDVFRSYDKQPAYTLMVCVGIAHVCYAHGGSGYPYALAVVDDYGTLVTVTPWSR
jgi:hypothetical protein